MSISATIPVADMDAANTTLEELGFGPRNFKVPVYTGPAPTHATLHAWTDLAFEAAVKAIPGVEWYDSDTITVEGEEGPVEVPAAPADRVRETLPADAGWGSDAPELEGQVTPGLYRRGEELWWVIQPYDTDIWSDPNAIPALIRRARVPGEVAPWKQPIDQFDAYKLVNPFTGEPDRAEHNGSTWEVSQADGAGNNVWEPGVFGWSQV